MLQKIYNEKFIRNSGEFRISQLFDDDFIYDSLDWYVFHSYPIAHHVSKSQGEADFLVVSQKGILIIEVKGGLIHIKNGEFYFPANKHKPEKKFKESPFDQADGCKYSFIHFLSKKGFNHCWVNSCVAFPDSPFNYDGIQYENFFHLKSKISFFDFINLCLDRERPKAKIELLSDKQLNEIINVLNPELTPSDEEVRIIENLKRVKTGNELNTLILEGLYDNPRLLMQGPPGSGKSTYAIEYARKKATEGKKGLFLTFNLLLADQVKHQLPDHDVYAMWPFFRKELDANNIKYTPRDFDKEEKLFIDKVKPTKKYDFIIIDEAQDLFGDALDKVLDSYLNKDKHNGEYLILYDMAQAFSPHGKDSFDTIKANSAHFKLLKNFRVIGSEELESFVEDAFNRTPDFNKAYVDIEILKYKEYSEAPKIIISHVLNNIKKGVFEMKDMVVLNNTDIFWKDINGEKRLVDFYTENNTVFEVLDDKYSGDLNKIWVTTPLRFKGLEKPVVYLIINDLNNKKAKSYFQFLIGITRAQSKLVIVMKG